MPLLEQLATILSGFVVAWFTQLFKDARYLHTGTDVTHNGARFAAAILSFGAAVLVAYAREDFTSTDWESLVRPAIEAAYIFLVSIGAYHGAIKQEK